ncbi:hypothetical protein GWI33_001775 [Rhynchophorus ferrugineus]|uniref:Uncharacterized protein n=1 Tax=Rhynchophorus ferrugineus TaxID=354439 RepID=A0A834IPZ3_RHYFE|nr:hypothetical protein GWI33_001775 [Rhynchophorus ferrugineus]
MQENQPTLINRKKKLLPYKLQLKLTAPISSSNNDQPFRPPCFFFKLEEPSNTPPYTPIYARRTSEAVMSHTVADTCSLRPKLKCYPAMMAGCWPMARHPSPGDDRDRIPLVGRQLRVGSRRSGPSRRSAQHQVRPDPRNVGSTGRRLVCVRCEAGS